MKFTAQSPAGGEFCISAEKDRLFQKASPPLLATVKVPVMSLWLSVHPHISPTFPFVYNCPLCLPFKNKNLPGGNGNSPLSLLNGYTMMEIFILMAVLALPSCGQK